MSEMIQWLAAQADSNIAPPCEDFQRKQQEAAEDIGHLQAHSFPARRGHNPTSVISGNAATETGQPNGRDFSNDSAASSWDQHDSAEQAHRRQTYRRRTITMLRRYMRYSLDTGRLPSLLGREFFRSHVTSYEVATFEDRVIFVHDMEQCVHRLDEFSQQVVARVILQEHSHEEAARLLGCTRMTVHRTLLQALDQLAEILLGVGLLVLSDTSYRNPCQDGMAMDYLVSDWKNDK